MTQGVQRDWVVDLVQQLPQATVSRAWGWLARRKHPRIGVGLLKRVFVQATGIDMSEAVEPIGEYPTLEDLFVRKLKAGARRIDPDANAVVSPVDGTVGSFGTVENGTALQVKGRVYDVAELLGDDEATDRYEGGAYVTMYLSPRDYHRIHVPVSGQVSQATLIPGGLLPVFSEALHKVDNLFARNERIVTYIDTPNAGRIAVVKVGATLVGRITLAYDHEVWSNQPGQQRRRLTYDPPRLLKKGSELGTFELGSTVIIFAEPGRLSWEGLVSEGKVRVGQRIGTVAATSSDRAKGATRKPSRPRKSAGGPRKSPRLS